MPSFKLHSFRLAFAWCSTLLLVSGCSNPKYSVSGRITCHGKPVVSSLLISPMGDGPLNTGPSVQGQTDADGRYTVELQTVGPHYVEVSPDDLGYDGHKITSKHQCSFDPRIVEFDKGKNTIDIELSEPAK